MKRTKSNIKNNKTVSYDVSYSEDELTKDLIKRHSGSPDSLIQRMRAFDLESLARISGFLIRKTNKIKPDTFLYALLMLIVNQARVSFSSFACLISLLLGERVSKQAIFKRIKKSNPSGFLLLVLKEAIAKVVSLGIQLSKRRINPGGRTFQSFIDKGIKRILLQDSSLLRLDRRYFDQYPGSVNQSKKDIVLLKIIATYELIQGVFHSFYITNFRDSDLNHVSDIRSSLRKGDLLLRDMGFFSAPEMTGISLTGAYFVSRYQITHTLYYCNDGLAGGRIDLVKMLKGFKGSVLDLTVLLSGKSLPLRLVLFRLPAQIANERRRKLKGRCRQCRISEKRIYLLGWNIYLTNLPKEAFPEEDILRLYSLRWTIETIFKSWKSGLGIRRIRQVVTNEILLESFIIAWLIYIVITGSYLRLYIISLSEPGADDDACPPGRISILNLAKTVSTVRSVSEEIIKSFFTRGRLSKKNEDLLKLLIPDFLYSNKKRKPSYADRVCHASLG